MVFNDNHTVVFISTKEDTFLVNLTTDEEEDIDEHFMIKDVKACIFGGGHFYVLANIQNKTRGLFLLAIRERGSTTQP